MSNKKISARSKAASAWRTFYETPEGKLAIGSLMARFHVYGTSDSAPVDAVSMAVIHGQRSVCDAIAQMIGLKPTEFVEERSEVETIADHLIAKYGG